MKTLGMEPNWPAWLGGWVLCGILITLSEWALLENPGIRGTIAAIAGVAAGGLGFQLIRGGAWRFGGLPAMSIGGLIGVKNGSILMAIAFGLALALPEGLLARYLDRRRNRSGAAH